MRGQPSLGRWHHPAHPPPPGPLPSLAPQAQVKELYESRIAEMRAANKREDFSDMVAAKAAQQKRKLAQQADAKNAKKSKGGDTFKF
jgi:hypothetical protein